MSQQRLRFYFAVSTAAATFVLICAGALVTATDSGLSVPDWPLSYGTMWPPMVGGVRFEHTHRMIAGAVGLMTAFLACWTARAEQRKSVRRLAWLALAAVLLQAILGGLTVLWFLPTPISVAHAALAMAFFCMTILLATLTHPQKGPAHHPSRPRVSPELFTGTTIAVYSQILIGAWMRHSGTGLAIPDFPLSYGAWLPPLTAFPVKLAFAHRAGALAVLALVVASAFVAHRARASRPGLARLSLGLAALTLLQIVLGAFTIWTRKGVWITTAHVACGALMLAVSLLVVVEAAAGAARSSRKTTFLRDALALTKPRLSALAVLTTLAGFELSGNGLVVSWTLVRTLLGTALCAAGASALNQVLECDRDARMERTSSRPLPAGRVSRLSALWFGVVLAACGVLLLTFWVNVLAGFLAGLTLAVYLFLYTPLKTRTSLCTIVGAVPGALPPLIGWAAARGSLHAEAWTLFAILFFWQLPHFLAIARIWREDYARAGFRVLGGEAADGAGAQRQIVLYSLALLAVTLVPAAEGHSGFPYFVGASALGSAFVAAGVAAAWSRTRGAARRLFLSSLVYLPMLLILMVLDRTL